MELHFDQHEKQKNRAEWDLVFLEKYLYIKNQIYTMKMDFPFIPKKRERQIGRRILIKKAETIAQKIHRELWRKINTQMKKGRHFKYWVIFDYRTGKFKITNRLPTSEPWVDYYIIFRVSDSDIRELGKSKVYKASRGIIMHRLRKEYESFIHKTFWFREHSYFL